MSQAGEFPVPVKSRRFSNRLQKLFCFGLLGIGIVLMWWRLSWLANLKGPQHPDATLCLSRTDGDEFAWAGLQDSQSPHVLVQGELEFSLQPKSVKFVNNKEKGTAFQIEWLYFGSSGSGDYYEFKIIGPSGIQMTKSIHVESQPITLLKDRDVVITIREKVLE